MQLQIQLTTCINNQYSLFSLNTSFNGHLMRILHTSDWHLGQNFYGKSREQEHHQFILWLIETIKSQRVNALVVAGDIFDTGTPPSYARELYNELVLQVQGLGCQLILLAGNHDSVATLNESGRLLAYLDVSMIAKVSDDPSEHLIETKDEQGNVIALICSLPFIRPRDIQQSKLGQSSRDKQVELQQQIKSLYQSVYECAVEKQQVLAEEGTKVPIIATGHLTVVGATTSESVRDIYVGTLDAFPAIEFPPVDYLALGHIHKPQKVAKSEHLRYCGSPIPLSFDELGQQKKVLIAEFDEGKFTRVEEVPVPIFQPMASLKGDLSSVTEQIEQAIVSFDIDETSKQSLWLELVVDSQQMRADLNAQIESLTAQLPVEVLRLRKQQIGVQSLADAIEKTITLEELGVEEVFEQRIVLAKENEQLEQALAEELTVKFKQTIEQLDQNDGEVEEAKL